MMDSENKILGIVRHTIAKKEYTLQFTWVELAELEEKWGENLEAQLGKMETLAQVAAIGFRARHPELTAERIAELSPPVFPFHAAVLRALRYSYFGGDDPDVLAGEIKGSNKKRNLFKMFMRSLSGTA